MVVIGLFAFFLIAGVAIFAIFGGAFGGQSVGAVTIWGTEDQATMQYLLDSLRQSDSSLSDTTYIEKSATTYSADLLNAMAAGTAPDLFVVSQEDIGQFGDKVALVPYAAVSQATFLANYIDEGRLFLTPQGVLALPFDVDPLVMYWNRDLYVSAGQASPPQYWSDLLNISPILRKLDSSQGVTRSAVALGTWGNITDAKAILSALFIQAGELLTGRTASGALVSTFGSVPNGATEAPAAAALRFYTEFANPTKATYSWNRALPNSTDAFAAGNLATYFGFASEYRALLARNPNLSVGVAVLPQLKGSSSQSTFGRLSGLAIPRSAKNPNGALAVAQKLTSPAAATTWMTTTGLPSGRRDVAADTSANAAASVFLQSALLAHGWVDPDPVTTDQLFASMIQSVLSGANDPAGAVSEAAQGFNALLPNRGQ